MLNAKRKGKNIITHIDEKIVEKYTSINELRMLASKGVKYMGIETKVNYVIKKGKVCGYLVDAEYKIEDEVFDYETLKMYIENKSTLLDLDLLILNKLCETVSKCLNKNQSSENNKNCNVNLYRLQIEQLDKQTIDNIKKIILNNNLPPELFTISLNVDSLDFILTEENINKVADLKCNLSIDIFKLNMNDLRLFDTIKLNYLELDLAFLKDLLSEVNNLEEEKIDEFCKKSVALFTIKQIYDALGSDMLLYCYNEKYEEKFLNYLNNNYNCNIYIIYNNDTYTYKDYKDNYLKS